MFIVLGIKVFTKGVQMETLGISCGRKNGNCEILLKEALMGVEETCGSDVQIIRLQELTVKPCMGCGSCIKAIRKEVGGKCIQKNDHIPFLFQKLVEADSLILAAPVYDLQVPGLLTMIANRFLGSGKKIRKATMKKRKIGAIITVGETEWTGLALPTAYLSLLMFGFNNIKLVDQMLENYVAAPGQVVLYPEKIARARKLGRNVGASMKLPIHRVKYMDEIEEACPVCHMNLLQVRGNQVVCAICEIFGDIRSEGDKLKVVFSEEEQAKSRWGPWGEKIHNERIMTEHMEFAERAEEVKLKSKPYKAYRCHITPPPLDAR